MRIGRVTLELILGKISIVETPTNMEPNPLDPHRQLALSLYRLGHGCTFELFLIYLECLLIQPLLCLIRKGGHVAQWRIQARDLGIYP